jgi:hypothetical protein
MKIYYAGTPEVPFNKPRAEAEAMIASGIAFAYIEPQPVRTPDAHFAVQIWKIGNQPYIAASCNGCGNKAQFSGPSAHRTQVFRHCGVTDAIPEHIAEDYAERFKKWKPTKKAFVPDFAAVDKPKFSMDNF